MQVKQLLEGKGREVATIERSRSVADALTMLKERRIGALVVTGATLSLIHI